MLRRILTCCINFKMNILLRTIYSPRDVLVVCSSELCKRDGNFRLENVDEIAFRYCVLALESGG